MFATHEINLKFNLMIMENTQITDEAVLTVKPQITDEIIGFLDETRKWAKFLAILGFIGCGLIAIIGLVMGVFMGAMGSASNGLMMMPSSIISIVYLLMAVLYFFPVLYLFRFSVSMGKAIDSGNEEEFTLAFMNLKRHYRFIGILTIVVISLYILMIIGLIIFGISGGMSRMF